MSDASINAVNKMYVTFCDLFSHGNYFSQPTFNKQWAELISTFLISASNSKMKLPIKLFEEATKAHPESGLAWYSLCQALLLCDKEQGDRAIEALENSIKYGCGYVKKENGKVSIEQLFGT